MKRSFAGILLLCCFNVAEFAHAVATGGTELEFIDRLTQQRQAVVDMSALAQRVSTDRELKAKADEFARVAKREIAQLQRWRTQWYGDRVQAGDEPIPPTIEIAPAFASLRQAADADFDKTYIDRLSAHDRDGIALARGAERNAKHPEMRSFAQQMITQQHREIERLKSSQVDNAAV